MSRRATSRSRSGIRFRGTIFDALTMERPYREARPHDEAFEVLSDEASKGWRDRSLVDAFVNVANA